MENTQSHPPVPHLVSMAELIAAATTDAETRYSARMTGKPLGAETPIKRLTTALGGSLAPGVHILHGTPGSGKTAFALQTACACQCPALFVTCEMPPIELLRRMAARVTGTYLGRFKTGELSPDIARQHFLAAAESAPGLSILDATGAELLPQTLMEISRALRVKSRADGFDHFIIALDSVHAWTQGTSADASEYDKLNANLTAVQHIAAALECPVLCIAERNRMSMATGGMSASAGTRRFEYGAESVVELNRVKDSVADTYGDIVVTVEISKNRHGAPTGAIPLLFNGARQEFRESSDIESLTGCESVSSKPRAGRN